MAIKTVCWREGEVPFVFWCTAERRRVSFSSLVCWRLFGRLFAGGYEMFSGLVVERGSLRLLPSLMHKHGVAKGCN